MDTEFPQFFKTHFEFPDIELGNRIALRFGLFKTRLNNENAGPELFSPKNSELIGSNNNLFTLTFIEQLREHKYLECDILLNHPERDGMETGHIFYKITMKSEALGAKISDDNREIEECYYDPFEKDVRVINEKLKHVVIYNEERQMKMDKHSKLLDEMNFKMKQLAFDKNKLLKEKAMIERENDQLRKDLNKIQNYDEIHIEIDLLCQSKQGVEILEKKYAILLSQLAIQKENKMQLDDEYSEIDPVLSKVKIIKERTNTVKEANQELQFNLKRHQDMLPLITIYQEQTKNSEKIINNLIDSIKAASKANPDNIENIKEQLRQNYQEQKKLEEKKLQMNLYKDIYGQEEEDDEYFSRLIGSDPLMNKLNRDREEHLVVEYQKTILDLNKDIELLTGQINAVDKEHRNLLTQTIVADPHLKYKKMEMMSKVENVENREVVLIEEVN
jgi:hypothetical protein